MKYDDIAFVNVLRYKDMPYNVFVAHKNRNVSDAKCYYNTDSKGRSTVEYLPLESLPKCVQKFIANHNGITKPSLMLKDVYEDDFTTTTYK